MGCGCGKKAKVTPRLPQSATQAAKAATPQTFQVVDTGGAVVASSDNIIAARVEARRVGGTVVPSSTASASSA